MHAVPLKHAHSSGINLDVHAQYILQYIALLFNAVFSTVGPNRK